MDVERKPYEPDELLAIQKAVDAFPNWVIYKTNTRERVRAFIAVLRWTGMRIGDAVQLSRRNVVGGQLTLRTQKNGVRVSVPMHPELVSALKKIENGEFYFWSGNGQVKSAVSDWHRTIERLGKGLPFRLHAHRFRHTFACTLLMRGVPVSEAAAILGNSPRILEKHYSQWTRNRNEALTEAVKLAWVV